jgi:hypothetical protein
MEATNMGPASNRSSLRVRLGPDIAKIVAKHGCEAVRSLSAIIPWRLPLLWQQQAATPKPDSPFAAPLLGFDRILQETQQSRLGIERKGQ